MLVINRKSFLLLYICTVSNSQDILYSKIDGLKCAEILASINHILWANFQEIQEASVPKIQNMFHHLVLDEEN